MLAFIVGALVVLSIVGLAGNAFFPKLLDEHPLLLLMLDARNRQLVLVATEVDAVPFFVVGVIRRMLSDPLYFLLGYYYGDRAIEWAEERFDNESGLIPAIERLFHRAGPVLVFFFPGLFVCVLAGATGMRPLLFFVLNFLGTLTVVAFFYKFGDVFEGPVGGVTDWIKDNSKWLTVVSVLLTIWWVWDQRRKGKSEIQAVSRLEGELEEQEGAADEDEAAP